ncbi:MAG: SIS domain-containing protein, partial [Bacilli bacterium]
VEFLKKHDNVKIVLCGAGSSEFVGNAIASRLHQQTNLNVESIASTNITANPLHYLKRDENLIFISFGRSGNSPESIACLNLVDQLVDNALHVIITCNENGQLALYDGVHSALIINLPSQTHDLGFAMTSSYSSMMIACLLLFKVINQDDLNNLSKQIIKHQAQFIEVITNLNITNKDRLVYLGSDNLQGIAQEAALKVLELTSGKLLSFYNTPLGFRHGPKSLVNQNTLTFIFMSSNEHTRTYEIDLINELINDARGNTIIVLDNQYTPLLDHDQITYVPLNANLNPNLYGLTYLYFAQLLSYYLSIQSNVTPDKPSSDTSVNRVVQGVILYQFKEQDDE